MKKIENRIIGFTFILVGILMVIHHVVVSGRLFDVSDMLHHEFFEAIIFTAGIVIILTTLTKQTD